MSNTSKTLAFLLLVAAGVWTSCGGTRHKYYPMPDGIQMDGTLDQGGDPGPGQDIQDTGSDLNQDIAQDLLDVETGDAGQGIPTIQCQEDADCGDLAQYGNETCTIPVCGANNVCALKAVNEGVACNTGNKCVLNAVCVNGKCTGKSMTCDDGNPCTIDLCDPTQGCTHQPNNIPCDDGNECTKQDFCSDGKCVGFNNQCVCSKDEDCQAFDDNNKCNGSLICKQGYCVTDSTTVKQCPPSDDPCQVNICVPDTGECKPVAVPDGKTCDDGNVCTTVDQCISGSCIGSKPLKCDDGDDCTQDFCDPVHGCEHHGTLGNTCDDNDPCTTGDTCTEHGCEGQHVPGCNCADDDECKALFLSLGGNLCQAKVKCENHKCQAVTLAEPIQCPASDIPCKANECDPSTGECVLLNLPDGRHCFDSMKCITAGLCHQGECQPIGDICDTPPANECTDAYTLKVWDETGTCDGSKGKCVYGFTTVTCGYVCADGVCLDNKGGLQLHVMNAGMDTLTVDGITVRCVIGEWVQSGAVTGNGSYKIEVGYRAKQEQ